MSLVYQWGREPSGWYARIANGLSFSSNVSSITFHMHKKEYYVRAKVGVGLNYV